MARSNKKAQQSVKAAVKRFKGGKLHQGKSKKKVHNPKQAIAIGLSEARKKGSHIPKKTRTSKKK